jgi:integrase
MPRSRLTELGIAKLTSKKTIVEYWDKATPGFGIRVMPSGFKSFFVMYRLGAVQKRLSLGRADPQKLAQVRQQAKEMLDGAKKGRDPSAAIEEKRANTFEKVAQDYITEHVAGLEDRRFVEQLIARELIPAWGPRPITDITPADAAQLVKAIKKRGGDPKQGQRRRKSGGPWAARHAFAIGSHLFTWARGQRCYGLEAANPFAELEKKTLIGKTASRDRILSDDELRAVWQGAGAILMPYREVVRMLMLCGGRLNDVAEMRWSEVDLDKRLITIPPERMKSDSAHVIPMSPPMVEILTVMPRGERGGFIFSTTGGSRPFSGFSKAKKQLDAKIAVILGAPIQPWVLHDLRRTFRTGLSMLRVVDRIAELCIAHHTQGLHKIYDQHKFLDERAEAMTAWARHLDAIVNPQARKNVVPFKAAAEP